MTRRALASASSSTPHPHARGRACMHLHARQRTAPTSACRRRRRASVRCRAMSAGRARQATARCSYDARARPAAGLPTYKRRASHEWAIRRGARGARLPEPRARWQSRGPRSQGWRARTRLGRSRAATPPAAVVRSTGGARTRAWVEEGITFWKVPWPKGWSRSPRPSAGRVALRQLHPMTDPRPAQPRECELSGRAV